MLPSVRNASKLAALLILTTLTACHREQAPVQAQRISLAAVSSEGEQPLPSPDTRGARWAVSPSGQAIDFGLPGERPFVTLACNLKADPPQLTLVRYAPARPGEKALFPVIGNGTIARFKVDAALADGEWRWQGALPADDPLWKVFEGSNKLEATLPGGGTVKIAGSRVPAQFIAWCRGRGQGPALQGTGTAKAAKQG